MTAVTVVNAVRDRLGDEKKERWDDTALLLYISLCQNDICIFTRYYRKKVDINLVADTYIYALPTDCISVNRFEHEDTSPVPVETRNNVDDGRVAYPLIVKDNLEFNEVEFKTGTSDILTAFDEDTKVLVYYSAVPELLSMDKTDPENPVLPTDNLLLPDMWFQAFLHFVSGMALQDDNDANNVQRGELEGSKYLRILTQLQKVASKDFTSNIRTKMTTKMRRT